MVLGQGWESDILKMRTDTLENFAENYINIQQAIADAAWESANAQIEAQKEALKGANGTAGKPTTITSSKPVTQPATADDLKKKKPTYNGGGGGGRYLAYVQMYHTGLKQGLVDSHSFDDDFNLVQETGLKKNEVPAVLKKGEAVATQEQISNIADGLRRNGDKDNQTFVVNGVEYRPLQPGDKIFDLAQKFDAYLEKIDYNLDMLTPSSFYDHQKQLNDMVTQITNSNVVNNIRNMQQQPIVNHITVTCPGVTSQQVAEQLGSVLGKELDKQFSGFHNYTDQMSRI